MSYEALNSAIFIGFYTAITIWIGLTILIVVQILKRNFQALKISFLYLINSTTFWIAWIIYFKLAVIVRGGPVLETLEKSIHALRVQANDYRIEFLLFSLAFVVLLALINIIYLKSFVKTRVRPRVLNPIGNREHDFDLSLIHFNRAIFYRNVCGNITILQLIK
jgi:hypothetical protein